MPFAEALRALMYESGLSPRELASALGVSARTIERHLAGRRVSRTRRAWYHKVKRVSINSDRTISIVVSYTAPTRKPANWSKESRQKKQARRSRLGAL